MTGCSSAADDSRAPLSLQCIVNHAPVSIQRSVAAFIYLFIYFGCRSDASRSVFACIPLALAFLSLAVPYTRAPTFLVLLTETNLDMQS